MFPRGKASVNLRPAQLSAKNLFDMSSQQLSLLLGAVTEVTTHAIEGRRDDHNR